MPRITQSPPQTVLEKLDQAKKMNLDTDLTCITKIDSKWTINIKVKDETIKLLEGNTGETSMTLGLAMTF